MLKALIMRKDLIVLAFVALAGACDDAPDGEAPAPPQDALLAAGHAYAADIAFGRAALEASIVDATNGYSARRLANYTADGWGALPVLSARVAPVFVGEPPGELAGLPEAPDAWTAQGVRALGEDAFYRWPGQIVEGLRPLLDDPAALRRVGLVPGPDGSLPLVWVELDSGVYPALTCATCHAHRDADGIYTPGRPSIFNYSGVVGGDWGPGRVDVTGDGVFNPTAVTDLRPLRFQQYLHKAATLHNDPVALAVRAETLMITSSRESWRPSRALAFGLAYYFWSLADDLPAIPAGPGRAVFEANCAGCHAGEAMTSAPMPIDAIGTPDAVGRSPSRGTGNWRVPSLRGVGTRGQLFSAGDVPDLKTLLDPDRVMPGGAMPGHRFGLDLDDADRVALLAFLQAL
ncbi:MAG: mono/diheme cytochrome c family protein [Bradymonadia bacterium]|jgi:mono/diheme cytochrome c family protein